MWDSIWIAKLSQVLELTNVGGWGIAIEGKEALSKKSGRNSRTPLNLFSFAMGWAFPLAGSQIHLASLFHFFEKKISRILDVFHCDYCYICSVTEI